MAFNLQSKTKSFLANSHYILIFGILGILESFDPLKLLTPKLPPPGQSGIKHGHLEQSVEREEVACYYEAIDSREEAVMMKAINLNLLPSQKETVTRHKMIGRLEGDFIIFECPRCSRRVVEDWRKAQIVKSEGTKEDKMRYTHFGWYDPSDDPSIGKA